MPQNPWLRGLGYPLQALQIFQAQPRFWAYIIWPLALNLGLGVLLYWALLIPGWQQMTGLITQLASSGGLVAEVIRGLGLVLSSFLILILFVIIALLLVQFGVVLGAPWYGQLSEELEKLQTGSMPSVPMTLARFFEDIQRALGFELKKLVLGLGIGLLLFPLNLIPGLGTLLAGAGSILLAAFLTGLSFIDPPLERRRLRFRQKLGTWGQNAPASISFSLISLGLVSLPLVNLLTIPLCIAAGTLFYCQESALLPKAKP